MSNQTRKISEFYWGLIFLASSIWICLVSIWKFLVYLEYFAQIVIFEWSEVIMLIINLAFVLIFIAASIYSFYLARKDPMGEKTNELWIKIALLVFLAYSAYAVYGSIDIIIRWA